MLKVKTRASSTPHLMSSWDIGKVSKTDVTPVILSRDDMWHHDTIRNPDGHRGVSKRCLSPRARAACTIHMPLQISGELHWEIRN